MQKDFLFVEQFLYIEFSQYYTHTKNIHDISYIFTQEARMSFKEVIFFEKYDLYINNNCRNIVNNIIAYIFVRYFLM